MASRSTRALSAWLIRVACLDCTLTIGQCGSVLTRLRNLYGWEERVRDQSGKYPYFGVPPAREPTPAVDVSSLRGKRVVLSTPEGFVYDMRAISQARLDADGREVVDVVSEEDYFRWMFTRARPIPATYPVHLVWVE